MEKPEAPAEKAGQDASADKLHVETEDEKAKRLAEQAEGKPKDEFADRTGRYR